MNVVYNEVEMKISFPFGHIGIGAVGGFCRVCGENRCRGENHRKQCAERGGQFLGMTVHDALISLDRFCAPH